METSDILGIIAILLTIIGLLLTFISILITCLSDPDKCPKWLRQIVYKKPPEKPELTSKGKTYRADHISQFNNYVKLNLSNLSKLNLRQGADPFSESSDLEPPLIDCICTALSCNGRVYLILPSGKSRPDIEGVGRTALTVRLLDLKLPYTELIGFDSNRSTIIKRLYLFSWNDIPGNDNRKLIDFLKKTFSIDWVETAEIIKNDNGRTIKVSNEKNSLVLALNDDNLIDDKTLVNIKIDDGRTGELIAKKENDRLNIYRRLEIRMTFQYLFSWDDIPGNNGRVIEFLKKRFSIKWAETAKFEKIDGDKTIRVTSETNSLSLKLNDEETKVNLEIDDVRVGEFIAKTENGKLNIYERFPKSETWKLIASDMVYLGLSQGRLCIIPTTGETVNFLWDLTRHIFRSTDLSYTYGAHRDDRKKRLQLIDLFYLMPCEVLSNLYVPRIACAHPVKEIFLVKRAHPGDSSKDKVKLTTLSGEERLRSLKDSILISSNQHGSSFWDRPKDKLKPVVRYLLDQIATGDLPAVKELVIYSADSNVPSFLYAEAMQKIYPQSAGAVDIDNTELGKLLPGVESYYGVLFSELSRVTKIKMLVTSGEKIFHDGAFWRYFANYDKAFDLEILMLNPDSEFVQELERTAYSKYYPGFLREEIKKNLEAIKNVKKYLIAKSSPVSIRCWLYEKRPNLRITLIGGDRAIISYYFPNSRTGSDTLFFELEGHLPQTRPFVEKVKNQYEEVQKVSFEARFDLFRWNDIPGNDNGMLIEFLEKRFNIDWVKTAKFEKIDGGKTIRVTSETNFLSLKLNDEETKVNLKIDDVRVSEFIAKTENGNLYIYEI